MKRKKRLLLVPVLLVGLAIGCYVFFQPGVEIDSVFMRRVSVENSTATYQYKNKVLSVQNWNSTLLIKVGNGLESGEYFLTADSDHNGSWSVRYNNKLVYRGEYVSYRNNVKTTLMDPAFEQLLKTYPRDRFPRGDSAIIHPDQLILLGVGLKNTYRGRIGFVMVGILVLGILYLTTKPPKAWRAASLSMAYTGESGQPLAGGANAYNTSGAWWVSSGKAKPFDSYIDEVPKGKNSYFKVYCVVMNSIALWFFAMALRLI